MKLYCVNNWATKFENNRTRELKKMDWVPLPNKQDGDGYTMVMSRDNGPALFGAWTAILQIASRCDPRGKLVRDGGKPHDATSIARMSRFPVELIQQALEFFTDPDINWLVLQIPQEGAGIPQEGAMCPPPHPAGGCLEGKGREGNEGKGISCDANIPTQEEILNECSMRGYTEHLGRKFFNYYQGNNSWRNQYGRLINWRVKLASWAADERQTTTPAAKQPDKPTIKLLSIVFTADKAPQREQFASDEIYEHCLTLWNRWKAKL